MIFVKPKKNKKFCIGCKRTKMLFESKEKADNFIKFNKGAIAARSRKVPARSYYCTFCCGWHITSVADKAFAKQKDEKDKRLRNLISSQTQTEHQSQAAPESKVSVSKMLADLETHIKALRSASQ